MTTPSQPEVKATEADDANIRKVAMTIADFFSPEGHDPEEWAQMCQVAEKVLRALGLWGVQQAVAAETAGLRIKLKEAEQELSDSCADNELQRMDAQVASLQRRLTEAEAKLAVQAKVIDAFQGSCNRVPKMGGQSERTGWNVVKLCKADDLASAPSASPAEKEGSGKP